MKRQLADDATDLADLHQVEIGEIVTDAQARTQDVAEAIQKARHEISVLPLNQDLARLGYGALINNYRRLVVQGCRQTLPPHFNQTASLNAITVDSSGLEVENKGFSDLCDRLEAIHDKADEVVTLIEEELKRRLGVNSLTPEDTLREASSHVDAHA